MLNAAVRALPRVEGRTERALELVENLRSEGLKPGNSTLQHVFLVAKGEVSVHKLLTVLMAEMRKGFRPNRATLNALLHAAPAPSHKLQDGTSSLPLLLSTMDACQVQPNGSSVLGFLRQARTLADVERVERLVDGLPSPARKALLARGAVLATRARVDATSTTSQLLPQLYKRPGVYVPSDPSIALPTPPSVWRALLLSHGAAREHERCLALLKALWSRGMRVDEHTARRLIFLAGEGAASREPAALSLLSALRSAMFGEGEAARAQRGRLGAPRRSEVAEHEAIRILARAECRAGVSSAAVVQEQALARLSAAGVAPRANLVATCVYLHASQRDFPTALRLLSDPPAAARENMSRAGEGPYLSLLSAVSQPGDAPHAVEALTLMLSAGVRPTLRTRIAFARMAARAQRTRALEATTRRARRAGPHVPSAHVPGGSRFWSPTALPLQPLLDALRSEGVAASGGLPGAEGARDEGAGANGDGDDDKGGGVVAAAAEMMLETRTAALLERIDELMRASSGDGAALASLVSTVSTRQANFDATPAGGDSSPEESGASPRAPGAVPQ